MGVRRKEEGGKEDWKETKRGKLDVKEGNKGKTGRRKKDRQGGYHYKEH